MDEKEIKEGAFLEDGDDFLKSTSINEQGKLEKAIPTMQKVAKRVLTQKKQMPKGFDKFKKEVEGAFELLDGICKEIAGKLKPEDTGDLLKKYGDFKQAFSWKINDFIRYPIDGDSPEKVEQSDYDKNRIKIT